MLFVNFEQMFTWSAGDSFFLFARRRAGAGASD